MHFAVSAYAIDPHRALSQYVQDHFGSDQGFPRGSVYAITQSTDGYLWIGTEAGLVRFDGWNFSLIRNSAGMGGVLGLLPDNEGGLWLRLRDLSLRHYRKGVFEQPAEPYSGVSAITRSSRGELAVWKLQGGALLQGSGGSQMLVSASALPRSPVTALADSQGGLWIGTRDAGLFRAKGGEITSIRDGLPDTKIDCLLADGERDLWIGTDNGIAHWNGSEIVPGKPAFHRFQALAIVKDRDANIWVGTDSRGLLRINARGVEEFQQDAGRSKDAVTAVFEDREGNLWVGSAGGLDRLRDSAFVSYSAPEGLPSDGSNPVFADPGNRIWFPSVTGGLWWVQDTQHGRVTAGGLDTDVVYSIAGGKDELWLGRRRGGLTRLRPAKGGYTAQTYTQANGLAQNSVYSVYQSRDGTVWAGTLSGGVSRWQGGKFTTFTTAAGLASNTVASILEGSDGTMWFATPSGLSRLSNGSWKTYTVRDGLPADNVNCLSEDSAGVLWIGTAAGLGFRDSSGFQVPAGLPVPLREQILGLAEDRNGSLWLSTSNHVVRVNRDHLLRNALAAGDMREYGLADGLRGVEGVKRHRSVVTDSLGRIWFSMNRGISVVDAARLAGHSAPAIPHIESLAADGIPVDVNRPIRISAGRQRIMIAFAGLNLSVPDRIRFRHRLDNFDHTWSEPVARREANFTNLNPGPYRFRVIASNSDGVWGSEEASLAFEVMPLFWQATWFRLSVVLGTLLLVAGFYRLRFRGLTRQLNMRFEERLAERTRIAQELHDTLLQGFLSANMQLHVVAGRVPDDSPAKPALDHVLELMAAVIEEGRHAVRGLRVSHSASLDLEKAFSLIQAELGLETPIAFRVIVEGQPRQLHPVLRDEVYRIGREALINAFRHSRARDIEIELVYACNRLLMVVRDNGCGIDSQVLRSGRDGHFGLRGMRERAERIGARLHVWSSAQSGTEVELSVPGHAAFQDQPSHFLRKWVDRLKPRKAVEKGSIP